MKIKFLVAGLLTLVLSAHQLIYYYSRTGSLDVDVLIILFILSVIIFLIFSKKEGNIFLNISVWLNLCAAIFYITPIFISPYVRGGSGIPFLFFQPISSVIYILSTAFLVLGLVRYFQTPKSSIINNPSSNIVH